MGSVSAALGVALGAFGAHGLKSYLSPEMLTIFETAVRYQMYHSFALLATALAATSLQVDNTLGFKIATWSFSSGILLFCGSLYLLSITGAGWLGAITPVGGAAFLGGWIALTWALLKGKKSASGTPLNNLE
jgi:uncharacterized membrane protein YgdD (TMEM256/DUF423 family)